MPIYVWLIKLNCLVFWQASVAAGSTGDGLRAVSEPLLEAIAGYKKAAASVKSLLPKAKAKPRAKAAA